MNLGMKIKKIRIENNLTQEELADILEISKNYLSEVERNVKNLNIEKLLYLCKLYNIDLNKFFEEDCKVITLCKNPEIKIDTNDLSNHLSIVGPSGCGKSRYLNNIIKQLIKEKESFISFMCKNDYNEIPYNENNVYIDFTLNNKIYNPLIGTKKEIISTISESFEVKEALLNEYLKPLIETYNDTEIIKNINLYKIEEYLRQQKLDKFNDIGIFYKKLKDFLSNINVNNVFNYSDLLDFNNENFYMLDDLIINKKNIIIIFSNKIIDSEVYKIFTNLILKNLEIVFLKNLKINTEKNKNIFRYHFIIDEFSMDNELRILKMLSNGKSYNVSYIICGQNLGESIRILENTRNIILFQNSMIKNNWLECEDMQIFKNLNKNEVFFKIINDATYKKGIFSTKNIE